MDYHVPFDPRLHFGLNGTKESSKRNSQHRRPFDDDRLQFLSREEKECIQFFEETIDSLEDDSEDPGLGLSSGSSTSVDGRSATPSPITVTATERSPSPREHDIIDLVRYQPASLEPRETPFNPPIQGFRTMAINPESHFEIKSKGGPTENFPSEFQFPAPPPPVSLPSEDGFNHGLYHPPGCIPTPVLIAQKIAEHQGGGTSVTPSSILSSRSKGVESSSPPPEGPVKQGPPVLAKPSRFPDNISFVTSSRDYNKTIAKAAVNVNERRAAMLSNLPGGVLLANPDEDRVRNVPNRSTSFQDPSPDRSRMEALSKLGLAHKRSLPSSHSRVTTPRPQSTSDLDTLSSNVSSLNITSKAPSPLSTSNVSSLNITPKAPSPSLVSPTTSVTSTVDFNSYGGKSVAISPTSITPNKTDINSHYVTPSESRPPLVPQRSNENVSPADYNSYGGKTAVFTPSGASGHKRDSTSQHLRNYDSGPSAVGPPPRSTSAWSEASNYDPNSSGGKSGVMTPAPASTTKIETSSESKGRLTDSSFPPVNQAEAFSNDGGSAALVNSYGGRSITVNPSHTSGPKPEVAASGVNPRPAAAAPPSVATRPHSYRVEPRSAEAPRPARQEGGHSSHGNSLPPVPEPRRKTTAKASIFQQGVTVQFSGRGATDESRKAALRKLGLMKNTP
ncbi:hypothetical protein GJAV_G00158260 [Gymnothorax javanicus]|nr:hypothetical protein GJAV_G00158260 [Gymnothorax javanicus]